MSPRSSSGWLAAGWATRPKRLPNSRIPTVSTVTGMALRNREPLVEERNLGVVKVYREDIAEVLTLLSKVSDDVQVQADGLEVLSLDQLDEYEGELIDELQVATRPAGITVTLSRSRARVVALEPDTLRLGVVSQLVKLSRPWRRRWRSTYFPLRLLRYSSILALLALAVGGALMRSYAPDGPVVLAVAVAGATVLLVMAMLLAYLVAGTSRTATVFKSSRPTTPSFARRNRDGIVIASMSTVVGSVIGFALGKLS